MLFSDNFRSLFSVPGICLTVLKMELFVMSLCMLGLWNKDDLLKLKKRVFLQVCLYQTSLR